MGPEEPPCLLPLLAWGTREAAGKQAGTGSLLERQEGRAEGEVKHRYSQSGAWGLVCRWAPRAPRGARVRVQSPGANTSLSGEDPRFQEEGTSLIDPSPWQPLPPHGGRAQRCLLDAEDTSGKWKR